MFGEQRLATDTIYKVGEHPQTKVLQMLRTRRFGERTLSSACHTLHIHMFCKPLQANNAMKILEILLAPMFTKRYVYTCLANHCKQTMLHKNVEIMQAQMFIKRYVYTRLANVNEHMFAKSYIDTCLGKICKTIFAKHYVYTCLVSNSSQPIAYTRLAYIRKHKFTKRYVYAGLANER